MSTGLPGRDRSRDRALLALACLVLLGVVALIAGAYLVGHALQGEELGVGLALVTGGVLAVVAGLRLDVL